MKTSPAKITVKGTARKAARRDTPRTETATPVDWEAIERDYRTGRYSAAELAALHAHGVTPQAIGRRAKARGWAQDLTAAVRTATRARVITAEASRQGDAPEQAVRVAAEASAQVVMRHRADALQTRDVAMGLLAELKEVCLAPGELEQLFDALSAGLDDAALQQLRRRFDELVRLPGRIASVQKIADALGKVQALERRAFSLDDDADRKKTGDDIWQAVAEDLSHG